MCLLRVWLWILRRLLRLMCLMCPLRLRLAVALLRRLMMNLRRRQFLVKLSRRWVRRVMLRSMWLTLLRCRMRLLVLVLIGSLLFIDGDGMVVRIMMVRKEKRISYDYVLIGC